MENTSIMFKHVNIDTASTEIQDWYENNKNIQKSMIKIFDKKIYILITLGEKDRGGYNIEILEIRQDTSDYNIFYKITYPDDDEAQITSFVYPYDLVVISDISIDDKLLELSIEEREFNGDNLIKLDGIGNMFNFIIKK